MQALHAQLFRSEAPRLIAALTRLFGVHNLALVEDVVQDAFGRALDDWREHGVPNNPAAWLMAAAKNRALDMLRRDRTVRRFAPELGRLLDTEWTLTPLIDEAFGATIVRDEQLRMMFSCCHPKLPEAAQLSLILNILCGFGAAEIAQALLESRAAVEKRIARGKRALAGARQLFDLRASEFEARLSTVQRALYLLFNEGYHGASGEHAVRAELCQEAMRLALLLGEHERAATPATCALAALIWLHAARLPARVDASGELSALVDQDRARWDAALTARWLAFFEASAAGDTLSTYHVEAAIAAQHAAAASVEQTDWAAITALYDRLFELAPSPVVALNRAIAIGQRDGAAAGITALEAIRDRDRLESYPFYPAARGEFELRRGNQNAAREHLSRALALARNGSERSFLERRLAACR